MAWVLGVNKPASPSTPPSISSTLTSCTPPPLPSPPLPTLHASPHSSRRTGSLAAMRATWPGSGNCVQPSCTCCRGWTSQRRPSTSSSASLHSTGQSTSQVCCGALGCMLSYAVCFQRTCCAAVFAVVLNACCHMQSLHRLHLHSSMLYPLAPAAGTAASYAQHFWAGRQKPSCCSPSLTPTPSHPFTPSLTPPPPRAL